MATKIIVPRRREEWFNKDGNFTHQAFRFFEELTELTNDSSQDIDDDNGIVDVKARLIELSKTVGSGIPLTIDTTGFTIDTTFQFTDQTEV